MEKPDYSGGLDALQADMAEHQRRFRGEPTAEANRSLAVDAIARLEREQSAQKPAPPPSPMQQQPIQTTRERKEIDGRKYLLKKSEDKTLIRKANGHEAWFLPRAQLRIALLLSKQDPGLRGMPSWRDRVMAALSIQMHATSLRAAAEDPEMFAAQKLDIERMQPLARAEVLKSIGASGVSDLTPEFARTKAAELERRFLAELLKVLEASSAVFGDWKKLPEKKIQVGGR